jgi:hypothetical protein
MVMIDEIQDRIDEYARWLRDKTSLRTVDSEWVEITTPYLDRHNDYLQIYARRDNGRYTLTDDGYILDDLIQSGCSLDSPKREALLKMTLAGFGVVQKENRLEVQTSAQDFPRRKHDLIQAMLTVNDLFALARSTVESLFYEDVVAWLDSNEVRYTPKVTFTGQTGYNHFFDFVIPKSRNSPERIAHTITVPTREAAQKLAFAWMDTREARPVDARAYAFLNDQDQKVPAGVVTALEAYNVVPVPWSRRDEAAQVLTA